MGRTMGVDFGERRLGVAISDPEGVVAGHSSIIRVGSEKEALTKLCELVKEEEVVEVVIGLPLSLRGGSGPQAKKVEKFAALLSEACGVNVSLWDERFSTVEAQKLLSGFSKRVRKQKEKRDLIAAVLILQSYLDRKTHAGE